MPQLYPWGQGTQLHHSNVPLLTPALPWVPMGCSTRDEARLLFGVKTLLCSLSSKRSPRGYKNSQQALVSLRSLTFFHWEFVYRQP